jgi:hypothetical protein
MQKKRKAINHKTARSHRSGSKEDNAQRGTVRSRLCVCPEALLPRLSLVRPAVLLFARSLSNSRERERRQKIDKPDPSYVDSSSHRFCMGYTATQCKFFFCITNPELGDGLITQLLLIPFHHAALRFSSPRNGR